MGDFESLFKRMIDEAVVERLPALVASEVAKVPAPAGGPAPLVDIRRACEFLKISETKLRGMCRAGAIPFHKVDGSYRFDLAELHEATRAEVRHRPR